MNDCIADITDTTAIEYDGTTKVIFKCKCGKEITVTTQETVVCGCKCRYVIGVRLYRNTIDDIVDVK